mmetsp:Transcript_35287/g.94508  ORF Transcript_35287/g.94508 Transcript_35287/m.94508 type:complete len:246 (+) Transcript_35287:342-1079(+)
MARTPALGGWAAAAGAPVPSGTGTRSVAAWSDECASLLPAPVPMLVPSVLARSPPVPSVFAGMVVMAARSSSRPVQPSHASVAPASPMVKLLPPEALASAPVPVPAPALASAPAPALGSAPAPAFVPVDSDFRPPSAAGAVRTATGPAALVVAEPVAVLVDAGGSAARRRQLVHRGSPWLRTGWHLQPRRMDCHPPTPPPLHPPPRPSALAASPSHAPPRPLSYTHLAAYVRAVHQSRLALTPVA